jgi:hypothetical protein
MELKNSHQVTFVCHCITTNGQMHVVHIGSNDCRDINSNEYKSQDEMGQFIAFEPLLQIHL